MGEAIGMPLQDVSETVLKGIGSRSFKSGIRKYNSDKSKGYNVVNKKHNRAAVSPNRNDDEGLQDYGTLSKEVQQYLGELSNGSSCKMSLIKM